MPLTTESTSFTRDVLGRHVCNTFDEALVTHDPASRSAAGLPARDDLRPFDVIIIGGGTFGAALAEHLWFRSRARGTRILVLEGGPFVLPEHVQNLPVLGFNAGAPRTDHSPQNEVWGLAWNSSDPIGFPGLAYCIGGRSVFWGGWSPRLLDSELPVDRWPRAVIDDLTPVSFPDGRKGYLRQASDQIGVTETNDFIFGDLHRALRSQLLEGLSGVEGAMKLADLPDHPAVAYRETPPTAQDLAELLGIDAAAGPLPPIWLLRDEAKLEAPLAVQGRSGHAGFFPLNKFSTVPLLVKAAREAAIQSGFDDIKKRLMIVPKCHIIRLETASEEDGQRVMGIITEHGRLGVPEDSRVVIALGTIESTRLALLSFGGDGVTGRNLLAHLRSNVDIRVPRSALASLLPATKALESSALFVKGQHRFKKADGSPDGVGHFHFQITATGLGKGGTNSESEIFKKIPDIESFDAHKQATDSHVVITIRGIGEMEPKPDDDFSNSVTLDLNGQQDDEFGARRAFVNLHPSLRDRELWDAMDRASDDLAKVFARGEKIDVLKNDRVVAANVDAAQLVNLLPHRFSNASGPGRRDGVGTTHHEAGTLRIGEDPDSSVTDPNGRFHQVSNVYVAGPALFPTIGSPNPMLTGIALVRRLGDHLIPDPPAPLEDAGFTWLFDGTDAQLAGWQMAGGGSFAHVRRTLIAQQDARGIGLLYYAAQKFEDFILRLDFLLPHPRGRGNDNSGVFVRFRDPRLPDPAPSPLDPADNAAFVAVHTGYEIQIDEEARGDKRLGEADGAPSSRTGAIYHVKSLGTAPGQQDYRSTQRLSSEHWHQLEIDVRGQVYVVRIDGAEVTRFKRAPNDNQRGNPPSVDKDSGFIGLQTHTGNVTFANIRIRVV